MAKPFAGKRIVNRIRFKTNTPTNNEKKSFAVIENILNKILVNEAREASGKEVVKEVSSFVRDNVTGVRFDLKKAKIIADKKVSIEAKKNNYTRKEKKARYNEIIKELDQDVAIINAEEQFNRFAIYVWSVIFNTPYDENYYKIYKVKDLKVEHVKSPLRGYSFNREKVVDLPDKIEFHKADDSHLRDHWRFQFGGRVTGAVVSVSDLDGIDFDTPVTREKIKAISEVIKRKFGKKNLIKTVTVTLIGNEDIQKQYLTLEFGGYKNEISEWDMGGSKDNKRQHGVRGHYSVQAPYGIATLAQIQQEVLDNYAANTIDSVKGGFIKNINKFFDETAAFIETFNSGLMLFDGYAYKTDKSNKIPRRIKKQNSSTDAKYIAEYDFQQTMFKGKLAKSAETVLERNVKEGKVRSNIDVDFVEKQKSNFKARCKLRRYLYEHENPKSTWTSVKQKRKAKKVYDDIKSASKAESVKSNEIDKITDVVETELDKHIKGYGYSMRGFFESEYIYVSFYKGISEYDEVLKKLNKELEDLKEVRDSLLEEKSEKWEEVVSARINAKEDPEYVKIRDLAMKEFDRYRSLLKENKKKLTKLYKVINEYFKMYAVAFLKLKESEQVKLNFGIEKSNVGVLVNFMGDVQKVSNKSVIIYNKRKIKLSPDKKVIAKLNKEKLNDKPYKDWELRELNERLNMVMDDDNEEPIIEEPSINNGSGKEKYVIEGMELPVPDGFVPVNKNELSLKKFFITKAGMKGTQYRYWQVTDKKTGKKEWKWLDIMTGKPMN